MRDAANKNIRVCAHVAKDEAALCEQLERGRLIDRQLHNLPRLKARAQ